MKIALVCDDLIQFGGQERLVASLTDLYPGAPLYTTVASEKWIKICADKNIQLHTSFMQKLPKIEKLNRYYSVFLLHILALESFDFSEFDVVLSVSSRFAHGVITKPTTKHICYMNTPGRMIWEPESYFKYEDFGYLRPLKFLAKIFINPVLNWMRRWDYTAAQRVDYFIANSKTPQERIKKYYGRDSVVVYPFFENPKKPSKKERTQQDGYYLLISRLQPWKRVDIAVECCSENKRKLKIIGTGSYENELKKTAADCVEFLGYVNEEEKGKLIYGCTALIQTQYEDFGIVPLEALSRGKPVIAFGKGGVTEIVSPGVTGEFFMEQDADSLEKVINSFDPKKYDPKACITASSRFSKENFLRSVQDFVSSVYLSAGLS
jgi:glycosyltransferase involved in cell wall biosynthesis